MPTTKLKGVVSWRKLPQYILYAKRGWHPERGATAECVSEEALSRVPLHVFQVAMGVNVKCHNV